AFTLASEDPARDEVGRHPTLERYGYPVVRHLGLCRLRDLERLPKAVWHQETPTATTLEIPRLLLSEETAAPGVKVALTGEGSDEVFGGYAWYRLDKALRPLARLPRTLRRALLLGSLGPRWRRHASAVLMASPEMGLPRFRTLVDGLPADVRAEALAPAFDAWVREADGTDDSVELPSGFARWEPFAQLQYFDVTVRLPDLVVNTLDHLAMACGVEARVPFLDHELVELAAQIPARFKMRRFREKHVLREVLRPILPAEIVDRPKRGLAGSVQEFLRGDLPEFARELLSPATLRQKGYFRPDVVADWLARHRARQGSFGVRLTAVLVLQLWDELFLKGQSAAARLPGAPGHTRADGV